MGHSVHNPKKSYKCDTTYIPMQLFAGFFTIAANTKPYTHENTESQHQKRNT